MATLKGKRTLIFAGLAAVLPATDVALEVLKIVLATPEIGAVIPSDYYPYYALVVALGTAILRVLTSTPVGRDD